MNAEKELMEDLFNAGYDESNIQAACVHYGSEWVDESRKKAARKRVNGEVGSFLNDLRSIDYDDGYGSQELFGYVWLDDGTWFERGEYDGSEWWSHKRCPEIPVELKDE